MIDFSKYFIVGTNSNALHDTMNGMVVGELIRCRDCRFHQGKYCTARDDGSVAVACETDADGYCHLAERKEK